MTRFIPLAQAPLQSALHLNNMHAEELSAQDAAGFQRLIDTAWFAQALPDASAFMIAFDQNAPYTSENFRWFAQRLERFVYVDRIVVAPERRGEGLAWQFYMQLFDAVRQHGHNLITCEVNEHPPNPASMALHARLGFVRVGSSRTSSGKKVSYLTRALKN